MAEFYISFATDKGFRGCTVVEADDPIGAYAAATQLGRNPGGDVAILEIPPAATNDPEIILGRTKLVSPDEMKAFGGQHLREMPPEIQEAIESNVAVISSDCNYGGRQ
jgi:hypothetical protein